jgi:RNA polymerase sigma-70 factor (ECF subfamily)
VNRLRAPRGSFLHVTTARDPEFYLAHAGYVRALARRLVYDPHAADDLFQAAWLAALERPARDGSAPRRWLAALVRNLASKSWLAGARRRAREQRRDPPPPASSPAEVLALESERRRVVAALLELDEPYRSTLIQRFFDDLEPAQIAARADVPVETVRTRLKRGLQRLRERLLRDGALAGALARGLNLGPPAMPEVMARLGQRILLMSMAKKAAFAVAVVVVAAFAWQQIGAPGAPGSSGGRQPRPAPEVAASAATAPAPTDAGSARSVVPVVGGTSPTGSLTVHVQWPDHAPAAGINARVGPTDVANVEASMRTARTGADGSFTIERLRPGKVFIYLDRAYTDDATIRAGERTEVTMLLGHGLEIRGHVRDYDGRPAADAEIVITRGFGPAFVVATSAADGAFAIAHAPLDAAVSARARDRAPTPQKIVHGKPYGAVEIELAFAARGGAIVGTVVDRDGKPVAGAVVLVGPETDSFRALPGSGELPPLRDRLTASDAGGAYRTEGVAAGDTQLTVVANRFAPWRGEVRVVEGYTARCDAVLQASARLRGTVRDEQGQPKNGGVRVGRWGITASSINCSADGSYELDFLPLGDFEAWAGQPGAGEARTTLHAEPGAELRWDPVLSRGTTLRGRVLADGRPVARCRVSARGMPSARANWFQDDTTYVDGRFSFINCPAGLLHLEARSPTSGQFVVAALDDVDPFAGEVVLAVDPAREPTAHVSGRVVDGDGRPVADAEVSVLPLAADLGGHSLRTDADGRFLSPGCPAGEWRVAVQVEGFARFAAPARAVAAGATVDWGDLVLARGGSVVVALQVEPGIDASGLVVSLADDFCGVAQARPVDGSATLAGIGAGKYQLFAYGRDIAVRPIAFAVADRAETRVTLPVVRGREVRVEVVDARGQQVDDRIETELFDASGTRIDTGPMIPTDDPPVWIRRLVAGTYELRLRDHLGRSGIASLTVAAGDGPLRVVASLR